MNRRERIAEHLDKLPEHCLRICNVPCACIGCAGEVNGTKIRPHELQLYLEGKLFDGQIRREDKIKHEILSELKAQGYNTPPLPGHKPKK